MLVIVIEILVLLLTQPIFAQQQSSIEFGDRGNRLEGIKGIWETSGAHIDIWGAYIDCADCLPIDSIKSLHLRFFLKNSTTMKILVRDLSNKNYWMIPKQHMWNKGWNLFEWPANEVLQTASIQIYELMPIDSAIVEKSSGFVVPFLLTGEGIHPKRQKYVFVFETSGETEINIKWLRKKNQQFIEIDSYDIKQFAGNPFPIERKFNSLDSEGDYRLQIRGVVKRGRERVPIDLEYDFYHKSLF